MTRIWDIWIRLFHWSLACAVAFLLFSGETSFGFFDWHRIVGETVLALIIFRLLWGIVGSSNARLSALPKRPKLALAHLRELVGQRKLTQERGHNAAGGWAVGIMLFSIMLQALTGLFIADEDELIEGAFYGVLDSSLSNILYQVHTTNATLIEIVVAMHVVMVFVYLVYAKQNLITPMVTGVMHWTDKSDPPPVKFRHWTVGAILALCVSGFLYLFIYR